jgi:RNA polymerase sigma-32 factor
MTAATYNMPTLTSENGLTRYLQDIKKVPMLTFEEEVSLAKKWRDDGNLECAHRMVTSHLRLVAKLAMGYRGYGLPLSELISEGNIGLMQAVKKFDHHKGFRLATYAMWWIRASMQEYILRSWSLVKMGTTAAQKKLFFNLRRLKGEMEAIEEGDLTPEHTKEIAETLNVREREVVEMNRRLLSHDHSLNAPLRIEGEGEWQDWLEDDSESQEAVYMKRQELDNRSQKLALAMNKLNERERHILTNRRLIESPQTLEELSHQYGVSRERIRQIEVRAMEKIKDSMIQPQTT